MAASGDTSFDTAGPAHFGPMQIRCGRPQVLAIPLVASDGLKNFREAASQLGIAVEVNQLSDYGESLTVEHCAVLILGVKAKFDASLNTVRRLRSIMGVDYQGPLLLLITDRKLSATQEKLLCDAGLHKHFIVDQSVSAWIRELSFFKRCCFAQRSRLQACPALFTALDHVQVPMQIMDADNRVQFVNSAFEHVTGVHRSEVLGHVAQEVPERRVSNDSQMLESDEDEAKAWKCFPVAGTSSDCITQHVRIRQGSHSAIAIKDVHVLYRKHFGAGRQSVPDVDTPIAEVLSLLREVQRKCESNEELQRPLQQAVRMLSSTDLYAPILSRLHSEDRVVTDLLSGLVMNTPFTPTHIAKARKQSLSEAMRSGVVASPQSHLMGARGSTPEIRTVLKAESTWEFDVMELERLTLKRPLAHLSMKILERWKVREFLNCSEAVLRDWLEVIESHYHMENPYHNSTHAADVLQACAYYLGKGILTNTLQVMEAVAALLAAIVHDIDHKGQTSAFLINSRNPLALLYNDVSVLENHHAALTFHLTLSEPRINIFARLNTQEYTSLRKYIVDMVLATDMNRHFEYLAKFQQNVAPPEDPSSPVDPLSSPDSNKSEHSKAVLRLLIKCADVSNPTRPWHLCKEWAYRIVEEYFRQTEEEKAKGLPLTMQVFDREKCNIPLTQLRFIDMFVKEMFEQWSKFVDMPEVLLILDENYKRWQAKSLRPTDTAPAQSNTSATNGSSSTLNSRAALPRRSLPT